MFILLLQLDEALINLVLANTTIETAQALDITISNSLHTSISPFNASISTVGVDKNTTQKDWRIDEQE